MYSDRRWAELARQRQVSAHSSQFSKIFDTYNVHIHVNQHSEHETSWLGLMKGEVLLNKANLQLIH